MRTVKKLTVVKVPVVVIDIKNNLEKSLIELIFLNEKYNILEDITGNGLSQNSNLNLIQIKYL